MALQSECDQRLLPLLLRCCCPDSIVNALLPCIETVELVRFVSPALVFLHGQSCLDQRLNSVDTQWLVDTDDSSVLRAGSLLAACVGGWLGGCLVAGWAPLRVCACSLNVACVRGMSANTCLHVFRLWLVVLQLYSSTAVVVHAGTVVRWTPHARRRPLSPNAHSAQSVGWP